MVGQHLVHHGLLLLLLLLLRLLHLLLLLTLLCKKHIDTPFSQARAGRSCCHRYVSVPLMPTPSDQTENARLNPRHA